MSARPHHGKAFLKVIVGGVDVTAVFNQRLLKATIIDRVGSTDECHIELDDARGSIQLPAKADEIKVEIGWPDEGSYTVFNGKTSALWSAGQKQGGRTLTVSATGVDLQNDAKSPMQWSLGDGTKDVNLGDALHEAAGRALIDLKVSPELAKLTRKYWMSNNESFMAFAQRIADEVGGSFKISGNKAALVPFGSFESADGVPLFEVKAESGINLLAWRICPMDARPSWAGAEHTVFNPGLAEWERVRSTIQAGGLEGWQSSAMLVGLGAIASKDEAKQRANADMTLSNSKRGTGWVAIDGEARAVAGGKLTIIGARPGVDGDYHMDEVEHSIDAQTGFTSRIDVSKRGSAKAKEIE